LSPLFSKFQCFFNLFGCCFGLWRRFRIFSLFWFLTLKCNILGIQACLMEKRSTEAKKLFARRFFEESKYLNYIFFNFAHIWNVKIYVFHLGIFGSNLGSSHRRSCQRLWTFEYLPLWSATLNSFIGFMCSSLLSCRKYNVATSTLILILFFWTRFVFHFSGNN